VSLLSYEDLMRMSGTEVLAWLQERN
jgi:hypothetical protein